MAAAITLRDHYDADRLQALAKASDEADQTRQLMALAVAYGDPAAFVMRPQLMRQPNH